MWNVWSLVRPLQVVLLVFGPRISLLHVYIRGWLHQQQNEHFTIKFQQCSWTWSISILCYAEIYQSRYSQCCRYNLQYLPALKSITRLQISASTPSAHVHYTEMNSCMEVGGGQKNDFGPFHSCLTDTQLFNFVSTPLLHLLKSKSSKLKAICGCVGTHAWHDVRSTSLKTLLRVSIYCTGLGVGHLNGQ